MGLFGNKKNEDMTPEELAQLEAEEKAAVEKAEADKAEAEAKKNTPANVSTGGKSAGVSIETTEDIRFRHGGKWYEIKKGVRTGVPAEVKEVLLTRGVLKAI